MSMLKTEYSIKFDLRSAKNSEDADLLFAGYKKEFISENSDISEFISLCLNLVNDFLNKKFDEKTLGLLVHILLVDEKTKGFFVEPYLGDYNNLLAFMNEILDLDWSKESPNYSKHLESLKSRFSELVEKYAV